MSSVELRLGATSLVIAAFSVYNRPSKESAALRQSPAGQLMRKLRCRDDCNWRVCVVVVRAVTASATVVESLNGHSKGRSLHKAIPDAA